LLFYQTTLSYSDLNSVILCLSLSYSGLNSGILFLDEVFRFVVRSTLAHYSGLNIINTLTSPIHVCTEPQTMP
jgi:hypothetical protein